MAAPFPYRLEQQLGIGGSGVVYAGVHVPTGIGVAIKTVHTASRAAALTLDRELAAMTRLRHPGILHLYDHGVARAGDPVPEGVAWLALELA
ncbi:MAG: hypothetical protein KC656_30050, partial [Myxococcales bacterium]|nr:hypothetical protein [Myxococcales bacterium]